MAQTQTDNPSSPPPVNIVQPTQQKIEDILIYSEQQIMKFPKFYRFSIGQDIIKYLYQELELAVAANKKFFKKTTLQDLDIANAIVQALVRHAHEATFTDRNGQSHYVLDDHHYQVWSQKLQEIGRMIGGWMKSVNQQPGQK